MILSLEYNVTFASTGRSLSGSYSFEKGMTAITGPNESGKSMILELIRYTLFGTDALRGSAADYTTINVTLVTQINKLVYTIQRTLKTASIAKDKEVLTTGTRPVNAMVETILGFDLEVFDISCAANQGDVEKLASMRPAERKRMVDRIIGADRIEELSKWCSDEALGLAREVVGLERNLVEPTAPARPEPFVEDTDALKDRITNVRTKQNRIHELQGWLSSEPIEPVAPQDAGGYLLEALQEAREVLSKPTYNFDLAATEKAWDDYNLWVRRRRFDKNHPRPVMSATDIQARMDRHDLEKQLFVLKQAPVQECPCGKSFSATDALQEKIQSQIDLYPPVGDYIELTQEYDKLVDWRNQATQTEWEAVAMAVESPQPSVPMKDLLDVRRYGISETERNVILSRLGMSDMSLSQVDALIKSATTYEARLENYLHAKALYDNWHSQADRFRIEIKELQNETDDISVLEGILSRHIVYRSALTVYLREKASFDERVKHCEAKKLEQRSWITARQAFNELREKIKTHLVPSLSKVASGLLSQMTGGSRNTIVIDEDFDVTVDGQPLHTLSGSGKACANLALRIGLGQVLTNNMLSLFVGDEIDASMDDTRASNLQDSLQKIKGSVLQIFLITHKTPKADHVISLKG